MSGLHRRPKSKSLGLVLAAALCAGTVALSPTAFAQDDIQTVTPSETAAALAATPGILAASDSVKTTSDADSAAISTVNGTTIDVPKDANEGVEMTKPGAVPLSVTPPVAEASGPAVEVAPGTTAYPSNNGASTAVQATEEGGVRMLSIIASPDAPTEYPYKVDVPGGGSIKLTDDGGAVVLTGTGDVAAVVKTPWAKDAKGNSVKTSFSTDGATLVQQVDHNVAGVAYPVTADPNWLSIFWRGATGCFGGKEIVEGGVRKFLTWGGAKLLITRVGTKWIPYVGWVACGYGAWDNIRG